MNATAHAPDDKVQYIHGIGNAIALYKNLQLFHMRRPKKIHLLLDNEHFS